MSDVEATPEAASSAGTASGAGGRSNVATGWRADERWRLVTWDETFFTEPPTDVPPPTAELAQPDTWATLYDGRRAVATWMR